MKNAIKFLALLLLLSLCASAFERQRNADYRARRMRLSQLTKGGAVLMFAPTEAEGQNNVYGFRQDSNFFYLTGWREPGAALLVLPERRGDTGQNEPYTEILFLPEHNETQEKWTGPKLGPDDSNAPRYTGFDAVESLDNLREQLVRRLPQPRAVVYTDLPGLNEPSPATESLNWLRRANSFPNYISFQDAKPLLAELRVIKDAGEIALIRKATDASVAAHLAAMRNLRTGSSEHEISTLMQYEFQRRGCERPAYAPIVGAGFNSTVLHYSLNETTAQTGEVVVLDVGGEYSMYATDITRTLPVNGRFSERQREIYNIVLGAQQAAIDAFVAGRSTFARTSPNSLYKVAYDYINTHGKDREGRPLGRYFIHGLSHFVGLEVHDAGDTTQPLRPGMVFTIEPGIYIPEEKLGVRIEDTFLVGEDGKLINLSGALPRSVEEVEKAMAK